MAYSNCGASCHIAHFDPLTHPGRRGLDSVHARWQRAYKPLLGVADTNHLLNIHIWVMLGNAEELIQVRKWLRVLLDPVLHYNYSGLEIRFCRDIPISYLTDLLKVQIL